MLKNVCPKKSAKAHARRVLPGSAKTKKSACPALQRGDSEGRSVSGRLGIGDRRGAETGLERSPKKYTIIGSRVARRAGCISDWSESGVCTPFCTVFARLQIFLLVRSCLRIGVLRVRLTRDVLFYIKLILKKAERKSLTNLVETVQGGR
jgi:hypothetical protein